MQFPRQLITSIWQGKAVPSNAPQTLAEGEFYRFYMRALCLIALGENKALRIYRAKLSKSPRPKSEAIIGKLVNPQELLDDLRKNIGGKTISGIGFANSGLSVELIENQ